MPFFNISDLTWDDTKYPRSARKQQTIDAYSEALRDRLSQTDKRRVARDIVSRDPECQLSEEIVAKNLGVTRQTVNKWIRDIRARQKASRDSTIHRLNRLGWGLRTWGQWDFNDCDDRFGNDWPGRIPAQLVAHTLFDFHRLLSESGWKIAHRIECPLSSERLSGTQVQRMQDKRILGTISRTLLIEKHI